MKLKLFIAQGGPLSRALHFVFSAYVVENMEDAEVVIVCSVTRFRELHPRALSKHEFIVIADNKLETLPERVSWMKAGDPLSVLLSYLQAMDGARESYRTLQEEKR